MLDSNSTIQGKKLILLEDEEVLGQLYTKALQAEGYEVMWLKSTEKLLENARYFSPAAILLDSNIRGEEKSGVDFIPDLESILPKAFIVILSNYDQFQLSKMNPAYQNISYFLKIDTPPQVLTKKLQDLFSS